MRIGNLHHCPHPFPLQLNDLAGAEALLDSALSHWRSRSSDSGASQALSWCLSAAIGLKLRLGKLDEAKQVGSGRGPVMATSWLGNGQHCEFTSGDQMSLIGFASVNTGNGATCDRKQLTHSPGQYHHAMCV